MLCILSLIDVTVGLKTSIVEVVMHMPLSRSKELQWIQHFKLSVFLL